MNTEKESKMSDKKQSESEFFYPKETAEENNSQDTQDKEHFFQYSKVSGDSHIINFLFTL